MGARMGEIAGGIGPTNVAPVTPYEAIIANTATTYPQDVFVTIPSIDQGRSLKGAVRWTPIPGPNGLIFPTKDDMAQVVRTNEGYYWVTQFVPKTYPAAIVKEASGSFPAASSTLDILVPSWASLVTIDFEYKTSLLPNLLLLPNGSTGNLLVDEHYTTSTAAPNAITHTASQVTIAGYYIGASSGAAGVTSAVGHVTVQTRPTTGGRRVAQARVSSTNTIGSGNAYIVDYLSACVIDANIGATTPITFLRFSVSAGNFGGGTYKARFT